jgi:hypothetical protein
MLRAAGGIESAVGDLLQRQSAMDVLEVGLHFPDESLDLVFSAVTALMLERPRGRRGRGSVRTTVRDA